MTKKTEKTDVKTTDAKATAVTKTKKTTSTTTKSTTKKPAKKRRKLNKQKVATLVIGSIASLILFVAIASFTLLFVFVKDKPIVAIDDFDSKQSSQIYDNDGTIIADIGETIRTNISYDDLPASLIDAFVSVEDSRFFEHNGFDVPRFTRAALNNLASMSLKEGGSTFTMQLVDNVYFLETNHTVGQLVKIERKAQEIFLAMDVESILSKERILELYLNKINFGGTGNIRGVQKAAEYYFNKDVTELNLSESALLAGIINAPTRYNPFTNLDEATARRNTVLHLMNYHGYITDTEYKLALAIKIENILVDPADRGSVDAGTPYQAYIDAVIAEVIATTGYDPTVVSMKIYTHMDRTVQEQIDLIQTGKAEGVEFPDDLIELGIISLNNHTGEINGVGGGRNYASGGSLLLNHATAQYKQPGSTVKPFLSYALAFENLGWATSQVVTDKPIHYVGTDIVIKNANNTYAGQVPLEFAFGHSLNTPAIQTLQEVIENTSNEYVVGHLNKLGFTDVTMDNFNIQYAIGGSSFEITVEQLAGAIAVMLNGGNYIEPHTVERIELIGSSKVIETDYVPSRVIEEESAYLVADLMYKAVYGGYYNYMQVLKEDYPIYAKTGTTDWGDLGKEYGIPVGAAKDIWMVGSTSEYTVATWYGYEKAIKDKNTWINDAKNETNIRGKMTNLVLDANHDGKENPKAIPRPNNVSNITHVLGVYPYTAAIEGMDELYIAHGKINSKFTALRDPMLADVDDLKELGAIIDAAGKTTITFPVYPDATKLTVAEDSLDISLSVGNIYVEAYGNRIFDWSWIYGPMRYRAKIFVNDTQVEEITSESNIINYDIKNLAPADKVKVCGVYAYEKMPIASDEVCVDFTVADNKVEITFPATTATSAEITAWAKANNLTVKISNEANIPLLGTNTIELLGADGTTYTPVNGEKVTNHQSFWNNATIRVTIYTSGCGENSSVVGDSCVCDEGYETDANGVCIVKPLDPTPPVPSITITGDDTIHLNLTDTKEKNIIVNTTNGDAGTITYSSRDSNVATVDTDSGVVIAITAGDTIITATLTIGEDTYTDTVTIYVT